MKLRFLTNLAFYPYRIPSKGENAMMLIQKSEVFDSI